MGIIFDNPTATQGLGLLLKHNSQIALDIDNGELASLIHLDFKNTERLMGQSGFHGVLIDTDSDVADVSSGICIRNVGRSDALYVAVAGKSGAVSDNYPTGIGIDLNRNGNNENSSTFQGYGVQIWDWSETNISPSPTGILLKKHNNPNTDHMLLRAYGNRNLIELWIPEGTGYDPDGTIFDIRNSSAIKAEFLASGNLIFSNATGIYFNVVGNGNPAGVYCDSSNPSYFCIRGGNLATQIINNAGNTTLFLVPDSGDIFLNPQSGNVRFGTYVARDSEVFDGYITIKDAAGNTRKIMTCA